MNQASRHIDSWSTGCDEPYQAACRIFPGNSARIHAVRPPPSRLMLDRTGERCSFRNITRDITAAHGREKTPTTMHMIMPTMICWWEGRKEWSTRCSGVYAGAGG